MCYQDVLTSAVCGHPVLGAIHPCGKQPKQKTSWFKKSSTAKRYCSTVSRIRVPEEDYANLCVDCQGARLSSESSRGAEPAVSKSERRLNAMGFETDHLQADWKALDKEEMVSSMRTGMSTDLPPAWKDDGAPYNGVFSKSRREKIPQPSTLLKKTVPQRPLVTEQSQSRSPAGGSSTAHVVSTSEKELQRLGCKTNHLHRSVDWEGLDGEQSRLERNLAMAAPQQSRQGPSRVGINAISLGGPVLMSPRAPLMVVNRTPPEARREETQGRQGRGEAARSWQSSRHSNRPATSSGQPSRRHYNRPDTSLRPRTTDSGGRYATLSQGEHPNVAHARWEAMQWFEHQDREERQQLVDPATVPIDRSWQERTYSAPPAGPSWAQLPQGIHDELYPDGDPWRRYRQPDPEIPLQSAAPGSSGDTGRGSTAGLDNSFYAPYAPPTTRVTGDSRQRQAHTQRSTAQGRPSPPATPPSSATTDRHRHSDARQKAPPRDPDPIYRHPSAVPEPLSTPTRPRQRNVTPPSTPRSTANTAHIPGHSSSDRGLATSRVSGQPYNYVTAAYLPEYSGHLEAENRQGRRGRGPDAGQGRGGRPSDAAVLSDKGEERGQRVHFDGQPHPRHNQGHSSQHADAIPSRSGAIRRPSRSHSQS
ncbi:hypothetical protein GE09DRAFT_788024 [Coniochaeta sp. 2T2.1]|nr:hypothetical protein GE09DRAFT_788024 [Coniochaeta sp. 2T2.1]